MTETDLQLGGGYKYQWECAILLALNYFLEDPSQYDKTLHDLITNFLTQFNKIQLEGLEIYKDMNLEGDNLKKDRELEDINLIADNKRILIQVKSKQAEGILWKLSDSLLLKSLSKFYRRHISEHLPENTYYVFLTNHDFNPDVQKLITTIEIGTISQFTDDGGLTEAGKLHKSLINYLKREDIKSPEIDFKQFSQMLNQTRFVYFQKVDYVEATIKDKLRSLGYPDWYQKYAILFIEFAKKSTHKGGGIVTRESLINILGKSVELQADRILREIRTNWTVPFITLGEAFYGRQEEIETIHNLITEHAKVGITGMGGLGKTQLAVEYAYHYKDEYPHGVFWINAANPLLHELAGLAEDIGLAAPEEQLNYAAFKLRDYLQRNQQALLVFDNLQNPRDLNQPISPGLIPSALGCNILFTTRQRDFPENLIPHKIKLLSGDASLLLLLRGRVEVIDPENPEHGVAVQIASALGQLPLALELASTFLDEYREEVTLTDYWQRLQGDEGLLGVIDDTELEAQDSATHHIAAISATLNLQWEQLDDEVARHLFTCAGQLAQADWIPTERLGLLAGVETMGSRGRPSPLSRGLKKLVEISLVEELTGGRLRLHPLVHDYAKRIGDDGLRTKMVSNLSNILEDMKKLEKQVNQRGVGEVIKDLSIGMELLNGNHNALSVYTTLDDLMRVLDREAHHLHDWDPQSRPSFLLQQLAWRAHAMQREKLAVNAENSLEVRNLTYLKWRWGALKESPGLLRILKGQTSNILSMVVTSDGKKIVTGSFYGAVQVWDLDSGKMLWELDAHTKSVNGVAMAEDGKIGISGSADGQLLVWDIENKVIVQTFTYPFGVSAVAISKNGNQVAAGLEDGTIQLQKLIDSENLETRILNEHNGAVRSLAFFGDSQLLSGSSDGTLRIWDVNEKESLETLEYGMGLEGMAVSEDGRRAVSVGHEGWKVWDLENPKLVKAFRGNRMPLCVALSKDGNTALAGTKDLTVEVWDLVSWQMSEVLDGHDNSIFSLDLSPDGLHVVSASDDLYIWKLASEKRELEDQMPVERGHKILVSAINIDQKGETAVSGSWDRTLRGWDLSNGNEVFVLQTDIIPEFPHQLAIRGDGSNIVIEPGGWRKWDALGNHSIHELRQIKGDCDQNYVDLNMLAISGDGRHTILGDDDGNLFVWDFEEQSEPQLLSGYPGYINFIMVTFDGSYAVSIYQDESIILWNLISREKLGEFNADAAVDIVTTDGQHVVTATVDHRIIVWDIEEETRHVLSGHKDTINLLALTTDGQKIISASRDGTIIVWDLTGNREVARFDESNVTALGTHGNILVVGNVSGSIYCLEFWEPKNQ